MRSPLVRAAAVFTLSALLPMATGCEAFVRFDRDKIVDSGVEPDGEVVPPSDAAADAVPDGNGGPADAGHDASMDSSTDSSADSSVDASKDASSSKDAGSKDAAADAPADTGAAADAADA